MTSYHSTQAFIFKQEDRSDSDRVFSVFTKDFGRVEIFGKAIRKIASKLRGGMQLFSFSRIEFVEGQKRNTLTDALAEKRFTGLSQDPAKLTLAFSISGLLDHVIKGQDQDPKIFELLGQTFRKLDTASLKNPNLIYYYFLWNLLSESGYQPELSSCALCQQKLNPYHLYFSYKEGGVICKNCSLSKQDGVKIKSDIVKIIRLLLSKQWDIICKLTMEKSTQESLKEISNSYYLYLLPK